MTPNDFELNPNDFEYNDPLPIVAQIVCALLNGDEYRRNKQMIKTQTTGMKNSQYSSKEEIDDAKRAKERAELELDLTMIKRAYELARLIIDCKDLKL